MVARSFCCSRTWGHRGRVLGPSTCLFTTHFHVSRSDGATQPHEGAACSRSNDPHLQMSPTRTFGSANLTRTSKPRPALEPSEIAFSVYYPTHWDLSTKKYRYPDWILTAPADSRHCTDGYLLHTSSRFMLSSKFSHLWMRIASTGKIIVAIGPRMIARCPDIQSHRKQARGSPCSTSKRPIRRTLYSFMHRQSN